MTEKKQGTSLFDSRAFWASQPLVAIDGLLRSGDYLLTSKPRNYPGSDKTEASSKITKLSDGSITVYRAMLGKFLAVLAEHGCLSLLDVTQEHVERFFNDPSMADASKETVNRYRRLLERVFDHLVLQLHIETNPVNAWLASFKLMHDNQKPEDSKERSKPDIVDKQTVIRLRQWLKDVGDQAVRDGDWRKLRDVVAAMLSVGTGLRASELRLLERGQFTVRMKAPQGQKIEINVKQSATVKTAQAHRVMVDPLGEELVKAWLDQRFVTGVKPVSSAEAKVLPGKRVFIGVGRELGKCSAGTPNQLSVSYFNRALKKFAEQATLDGAIADEDKWLLCRGAQGLRRAYALVEIQSNAKPTDLRIKLGLHLESSVKKYEHEYKATARARAKRVKV